MSGKVCILHASVFPHDPRAVQHLSPNLAIVPGCVREELDRKKKRGQRHVRDMARIARWQLTRYEKMGACKRVMAIPQKGSVHIDTHEVSIKLPRSPREAADLQTLSVAMRWKESEEQSGCARPVILMTRERHMIERALALGIEAEYYEHRRSARRNGMRKQKFRERKVHSFA